MKTLSEYSEGQSKKHAKFQIIERGILGKHQISGGSSRLFASILDRVMYCYPDALGELIKLFPSNAKGSAVVSRAAEEAEAVAQKLFDAQQRNIHTTLLQARY
jgi:hypothetical protein